MRALAERQPPVVRGHKSAGAPGLPVGPVAPARPPCANATRSVMGCKRMCFIEGSLPMQKFDYSIRVHYPDTDAGGIVYHGTYLKFFDVARSEWLRSHGIEQQALREHTDVVFVVCSAHVEYLRPAQLDDLLTIRSYLTRLGRVTVEVSQQAWRGDVLLARAQVKMASVDVRRRKAVPLPASIVEMFGG